MSEPAAKPIKAVLAQFLSDQRERLAARTVRKYESVIELFESSMDGYASQYLDQAESGLYDRLYNARGPKHREFCEIFGAEKIPENVSEFLRYFMPHKVICGEGLLRASGTVMKKLGKWLRQEGFIGPDTADYMTDSGTRASRDLPAAKALARTLADYADGMTTPVGEVLEGYFTVESIGPGTLTLTEMLGDRSVCVPVPKQAARACCQGWTVCGQVGKTSRGWRLVEVWSVYA